MKITLTLLFAAVTIVAIAQQMPPIVCGNDIYSKIVRREYPAYARHIDDIFHQVSEMSFRGNDEPLHVKVVVHVVWNAPEENLHDSIILDQISGLNQDYNRLNQDTADLREIFHIAAGSANIHFELEEIVRVHTSELFSIDILSTNLLAEVKHSEDGGSDAWDTGSYLNIWIAKIQPIVVLGQEVGQILGFAYPPAGLDNWPDGVSAPTPEEDGVVLDYRVIGRNNPNTVVIPDGSGDLLTVKGRTATHEIGHYLGLRHIWGDNGLFGPNDCQQSDGIDDTPFADSQSAFDCDKEKNSCPQIEEHYQENMPDLVENFMDYARDDCMNMFTKGQVTHMRNVLNGPRAGLLGEISSVETHVKNEGLEIFPNPAATYLRIKMDNNFQGDVFVQLLTLDGKVCIQKTEPSNDGIIEFSLPHSATGLHVLKVIAGDELYSELVVVVKN